MPAGNKTRAAMPQKRGYYEKEFDWIAGLGAGIGNGGDWVPQ